MHVIKYCPISRIMKLGGRWGQTKIKESAWYEVSTIFVARDVSEKYQSQIHRALEHLELGQSLYCK